MKKLVVQQRRFGPYRSSMASTSFALRTRSASQVKRRCDLWRNAPLSGAPVPRSNASSLRLSSSASASGITRTGNTQPSRQKRSIWVWVRTLGIDNSLKKLSGPADHAHDIRRIGIARPAAVHDLAALEHEHAVGVFGNMV